jgi:F-type H+-transporting ATPase subunit epsilon
MMKVQLLTPQGVAYEGQATFVVASTQSGSVGLLQRHEPMITLLKEGEVRVDLDNQQRLFAVDSGILEVNADSEVVVLANTVRVLK